MDFWQFWPTVPYHASTAFKTWYCSTVGNLCCLKRSQASVQMNCPCKYVACVHITIRPYVPFIFYLEGITQAELVCTKTKFLAAKIWRHEVDHDILCHWHEGFTHACACMFMLSMTRRNIEGGIFLMTRPDNIYNVNRALSLC